MGIPLPVGSGSGNGDGEGDGVPPDSSGNSNDAENSGGGANDDRLAVEETEHIDTVRPRPAPHESTTQTTRELEIVMEKVRKQHTKEKSYEQWLQQQKDKLTPFEQQDQYYQQPRSSGSSGRRVIWGPETHYDHPDSTHHSLSRNNNTGTTSNNSNKKDTTNSNDNVFAERSDLLNRRRTSNSTMQHNRKVPGRYNRLKKKHPNLFDDPDVMKRLKR